MKTLVFAAVFAAVAVMATAFPIVTPATAQVVASQPCQNGKAGGYPCKKIDLLSFMPVADFGGARTSDVWGWADPDSGKEYALVGSTRGLLFVDVTDPTKPIYLGNLAPKAESALIWQDVEVYKDFAYVVCDLSPCGLQVFDLTKLRDATGPQTWTPDFIYPISLSTHSLDINPDTGFLYLNGSYLSGGSQIVDVNSPPIPRPAGFIQDDGYTHDTHCRLYKGPDKPYQGKEICFTFNEDTINVYDATSKLPPPTLLAKVTYDDAAYTHSGWLTEDHSYMLSTDEADETSAPGKPSTTYIWDVRELTDPKLIGIYEANNPSIDHNQFIKGRYAFHASYTAGLRVLDTKKIAAGKLKEVAFFDVMPETDDPGFDGSWSVYPYLPSGNILVGGMGQGLFVVRAQLK